MNDLQYLKNYTIVVHIVLYGSYKMKRVWNILIRKVKKSQLRATWINYWKKKFA